MLKRQMSVSIVALTSAVLLFIGVTFAWLTLTDVVHLGGTEVAVNGEDLLVLNSRDVLAVVEAISR